MAVVPLKQPTPTRPEPFNEFAPGDRDFDDSELGAPDVPIP
jgi:hypothetical protein